MTTTLTVAEAELLVVDALVRSRTGEGQAASVARALVGAELCGQDGHGLRRLATYAAQSACGKVDGFAEVGEARPLPGLLALDAAHGFAFPALERAVGRLPDVAANQGIAAAAIRRSHHAGVAGLTVEAVAERGLMALLLANTPAAIAPWGGATGLFGTNPIAFAAPIAGAAPLVIDLSVSKVARGKIMAAATKDAPIPEGWALDAEGRPTTDPEAALGGTMVPMGDAKGAALALMVEALAAGLTGAAFGHEASSFLSADGPPPNTGQILIAVDPGPLGGDAPARMAVLAEAILAQPGTRLPGRARQALRRERMAAGLTVEDRLLETLTRLAREGA